MDKTLFSKKCEIVGEAASEWDRSDTFQQFFIDYDLGSAYAFGVWQKEITLMPKAERYVEEVWEAFCELLGVDHHGDYSSLDNLLEIADLDE